MILRLCILIVLLLPMTLSASSSKTDPMVNSAPKTLILKTTAEVIVGENPYTTVIGRYPEWLQKLRSRWIGWKPTGYETFGTEEVSDLSSGAKLLSLDWDIRHHPALRQMAFHFPDGTVARGLLATQPTQQARPLLIFRSGIFSNIDEMYPERAFAILFFEQLGFHVLVIENMTSADYYENNHRVSFGGFDEGLQNLWLGEFFGSLKSSKAGVAKTGPMLQAADLGMNISKIHLMGVSLGGAGVMWASRFDDEDLYSTYMGLCPVVDLKATMSRLTAPTWVNFAIGSWAQRRLIGVTAQVAELKASNASNIFAVLQKVTEETYQAPAKELWPAKYQNLSVPQRTASKNSDLFWRLNDFIHIPSAKIHPVTVWVNKTDFIVLPTMNADLLKTDLKIWPRGVHCSFPTAENWQTVVEEFLKVFKLQLKPFAEEKLELRSHDSGEKNRLQGMVLRLVDFDLGQKSATVELTNWERKFLPSPFEKFVVDLRKMDWKDSELDHLGRRMKISDSAESAAAVHDWLQRQISLKLKAVEAEQSQCESKTALCAKLIYSSLVEI